MLSCPPHTPHTYSIPLHSLLVRLLLLALPEWTPSRLASMSASDLDRVAYCLAKVGLQGKGKCDVPSCHTSMTS